MDAPRPTVPAYSAYALCHNNAGSIRDAVLSLLQQSPPPAEVVVIDDGSSDDSQAQVADLPVRWHRVEPAQGRGHGRHEAMRLCQHDLVLCCDAGNRLIADFFNLAYPYFNDADTAAVFGPLRDPNPRSLPQRWRARHLFKQRGKARKPELTKGLSTFGMLARKQHFESAGGFNPKLRYNEDIDLGLRISAAGFKVYRDPALITFCNVNNSLAQVLERYWRWHSWNSQKKRNPLSRLVNDIRSAVTVMVPADWRDRDLMAALISLGCPWVQLIFNLRAAISRGKKG